MSPLQLHLFGAITIVATGFSKDYLPPGGGWDYLFEGGASAGSASAALDGTWDHNNN
ncbi:MAG: hypothetical protein GY899_19030, partial [Verrucomicrobiaceae bacterium]|nr:hypothetical protein [Verrucomicrobiaceae bacterium]